MAMGLLENRFLGQWVCWLGNIEEQYLAIYTQGTIREQSGNNQGTIREQSGNNQGTIREHSGNNQGTIREHSGNIQG
jgi:hypothetical protein